MKLLSKACAIAASCPAVYELEDGSGDLLIVGMSSGLLAVENDVPLATGEHAVRIARTLLEQALKSPS